MSFVFKVRVKYSFYRSSTALVSQGVLIIEDSWSHSDTPHSVGLFWTSDQPDAGPLPDDTKISQERNIHAPAGFEPTIPASELLQTHVLDRAATKGQVLIKINKLWPLLSWYLRRIPILIKHPTLMCKKTYKCLCRATVQNQAMLCTLRAVRIYIDRNKTWAYQYQQPLADERTNHTSHPINTTHPTNHMSEDNKSFYFTPNAFLLIFLRFLLHLWFSIMFQIMAHYFVTPSFAACFLLALSLIFCFLLTEHLFLFGSFILLSSFYQHFYKRKCGYQISTVAMGTEVWEE